MFASFALTVVLSCSAIASEFEDDEFWFSHQNSSCDFLVLLSIAISH